MSENPAGVGVQMSETVDDASKPEDEAEPVQEKEPDPLDDFSNGPACCMPSPINTPPPVLLLVLSPPC